MSAINKPDTYCNPLPLDNYQRGVSRREEDSLGSGWYRTHKRPADRQDFREMADPTVIQWQERWYLFPSRGMLWHSDDLVNWTFQPIGPFDVSDGRTLPEIGYAPTVVEWKGWLLLTACWTGNLWRARDPSGPWENMGPILDEDGNAFVWNDPMLFVDDDGALYCYHGLGSDGIYVVKMRDDDPTRFAEARINCFAFNPTHEWERFGQNNQDSSKSYIEGAWMLKHKGRYYLTYSAPATQHKNYAMGCYQGATALGPWVYQESSPFLLHKGGLVNGCGHGSIVKGPGETFWCFYTTSVRIEHNFERRIGMDPIGFDANGDIFCHGPSETPQLAPGLQTKPELNNGAGWANLSAGCIAYASSSAPGRDPMYAFDDHIQTWWEAEGDGPQWLTVDLDTEGRPCSVAAARVMFADRGLNYAAGFVPGPYCYRIDGSVDGESWFELEDQSDNQRDRHIAYHAFEQIKDARFVRITVLNAPAGLRIALWEFTVFGVCH